MSAPEVVAAGDSKENKGPTPIKITLPDGKQFDGEAWRTTPNAIAEKISKRLAEATVITKVNGAVWDSTARSRFEGDATLHLLKFDDYEAKQVSRHSSAHKLGESMERFVKDFWPPDCRRILLRNVT